MWDATNTSSSRRRCLLLVLAGVSCAAALAGCGSSGEPSGSAAGGGPLLTYARCMRSHGLSNFPDPGENGPGLVIPNDVNTEAPAFRFAQRACGKLARGSSGLHSSSESRRLEFVALARCMRKHGIANFADPTSSPPPPSSGNAIGVDGLYLAIGTPQAQGSPAFKRAASACGFIAP